MSTLHAIQAGFQQYLLGPDEAGSVLAGAVRAPPGLVQQRLAIYHRAYRSRMREALGAAYDKSWSYLGDDLFAALAGAYLDGHPSQQPNLRWYGAGFAGHAAQALPACPWVAELARFEWSLGLAFDAADTAPAGAADLAGIAAGAWGELRFGLHPSARLLSLEWNAVALWQALDGGAAPPPAQRTAAPSNWLVWRRAGQPHFRSLEADEAAALERIGAGQCFGAVCEQAGAQAVPRLARWLRSWLEQEVLTLAPDAPVA